jgi:hypothetical protein
MMALARLRTVATGLLSHSRVALSSQFVASRIVLPSACVFSSPARLISQHAPAQQAAHQHQHRQVIATPAALLSSGVMRRTTTVMSKVSSVSVVGATSQRFYARPASDTPEGQVQQIINTEVDSMCAGSHPSRYYEYYKYYKMSSSSPTSSSSSVP